MIKEVDWEYIKKFFRPFPTNIFVLPKYEHFFALEDEYPVSMIGINKGKIACLYTLPTAERKGYASELVRFVIEKYGTLEVLANENSMIVYSRAGFNVLKRYDRVNSRGKHYSLWRMKI